MLGFQLTNACPVVPDSMEACNKPFFLELLNNQPKVACKAVDVIKTDFPVACTCVPFIKLLDNLLKKLHSYWQEHAFLVCEPPACCQGNHLVTFALHTL